MHRYPTLRGPSFKHFIRQTHKLTPKNNEAVGARFTDQMLLHPHLTPAVIVHSHSSKSPRTLCACCHICHAHTLRSVQSPTTGSCSLLVSRVVTQLLPTTCHTFVTPGSNWNVARSMTPDIRLKQRSASEPSMSDSLALQEDTALHSMCCL